MLHQVIHLKDHFAFLGNDDCDPTLTTYLYDTPWDSKDVQQPKPALLILPGGGYYFVSGREGEPVALNFMAKGYRVFVLNYSVHPHRFPTAIREVAAAMELIHANAEVWNVDTARIAIMGFSAGGHLAGHYSNCYDHPQVRDRFPESKPVNAAVLCYAVTTALPEHRHIKSFIHLTGNNPPTEEDVEKYSLNNLVSEKTPPTFLWHTRTDTTLSVMNTLLYAQALAVQGTPFALHIYPFGPHGLSTADQLVKSEIPENVAQVHGWMDEAALWLSQNL